ncbi:cobalamin biosynthesis protein [Halomonas sp. 707D7]|uniref:cobalamin biosynthesis protein n=1 Tax=Halomonas sp. 707D7 TaxID=1681044 RepID=UPI00346032A2
MAGRAMKVAGLGYNSEATLDSLSQALEALIERFGPVDRLTAAESKRALVQRLGRARGLSVIVVADEALARAETLTHSARSHQAFGTGSVAGGQQRGLWPRG